MKSALKYEVFVFLFRFNNKRIIRLYNFVRRKVTISLSGILSSQQAIHITL